MRVNLSQNINLSLGAILIAPDGTRITLFATGSLSGQNLTNTVFNSQVSSPSAPPITAGIAPYSGTFLPAQSLAGLAGKSLNGPWTLLITNSIAGATGTLAELVADCDSHDSGRARAAPIPACPGGRCTLRPQHQ